LVICLGDVTDMVVAAPHLRLIDAGGLYGEARIAVARRDAKGRLLWWAAADAYRLDIDGQAVLPRRGTAEPISERLA